MVIVIHGAPGCGKTTVAALLHKKLKCPWFEFGWIPEFTWRNPHTEISSGEEEQLSFENLLLVTRNYLHHGFAYVILSDLSDVRVPEIAHEFPDAIIFTLYSENQSLLKERIFARKGENTYKDWPQAQRINEMILARQPLQNEHRICVDNQSPEEIMTRILQIVKE